MGRTGVIPPTLVVIISTFCAWITIFTYTEVLGETININASAVVNGDMKLPCSISPSSKDDKTLLVLWYKEGFDNPIYSLDLRKTPKDTEHVYPSDDIRSRLIFDAGGSPAYLIIRRVTEEDEGVFRCRVDFKRAQTRNYVINLRVVVPPKQPTILGEKGLEMKSIVGPYNEGSIFFLSCEVAGGRPPPHVTWWRGPILLDDDYEVTSLGTVRNDFLIQSLARSDFNAVFTCKASNNNITEPASTSVTVDMNLKPLEVKIASEIGPMSINKRYEIMCQSAGSRPPPSMAWWKGKTRMKRTEEVESHDTNITTSILLLVPISQDNGMYLSCRAENPAIPNSGVEDGRTLVVYYPPNIQLDLGAANRDKILQEGDDIVLECNIDANPTVTKIEWKFQGKPLHHNVTAGILVINQSLLIQRVHRYDSGSYQCIATNQEGSSDSNLLTIKIGHIPFCVNRRTKFLTASKNEELNIICEVNSYPTQVDFRWTFNGSQNALQGKRPSISSESTKSILILTMKDERDFGVFHCWAANEIGEMLTPCAFIVTAVAVPDPAQNCSILNETESTVEIFCHEGYNGGLPQTFMCEVIDASTREFVQSLTNSSPVFHITNLPSSSSFHIFIVSLNEKGRSAAIKLMANTSKANQENSYFEGAVVIVIGVVLGGMVVLAVGGIAIIVYIHLRSMQRRKQNKYQQEKLERNQIPLINAFNSNDEKSPEFTIDSKEKHFTTKVKIWAPNWPTSDTHENNFQETDINCGRPLLDGINDYRYPNRKILPER